MVEKNSPDDEQFEDNFEDDFDFGEEEPEQGRTPPPPRGKPNSVVLSAVGIIILSVIGYMGWKYIGTSSTGEKVAEAHKEVIPQTTTPSVPATQPIAKQTLPAIPKPPQPTSAQHKEEPSIKGIEEAFSSADTEAPHKNAPASTSQSVTNELSLSEIQKELFTPEKLPIKPSQETPTPIPSPPPQKSIEAEQMAEAMKILSRLNEQMEYTINQTKQLDAYTREIAQNIAKLNSDISGLDNRVLALTNTTSSLSKDIGSVKSEVGRSKKAVQEAVVALDEEPGPRRRGVVPGCCPEEVEFTVHAVIPGRAWLKTCKGQIITVTEGEAVGNYGKVLVIDAANGVVLTNSGITFR